MKKVIVKKGNKYRGKWVLDSDDIGAIVMVTVVVGYVLFQILRSI